MNTCQRITTHLQEEYGGMANLIVKDPREPSGFRTWQDADTRAVAEVLERTSDDDSTLRTKASTPEPLCLNLTQAAQITGVGPRIMSEWLSRSLNPLPHIRAQRRVVIPRFILMRWLEEESLRTIASLCEGIASPDPLGPDTRTPHCNGRKRRQTVSRDHASTELSPTPHQRHTKNAGAPVPWTPAKTK